MIEKAGRTTPDWWDSASLNYPQTLDLTWEKAPQGQWIPEKYLGPYIISVITPNPGKWKDGAKLLHHTLTVNKDDRERLGTSMERLGYVYGKLLGDYARAAFWWQKAAKYGANVNALFLAEAYFKLGSKDMAAQLLARLGDDNTGVGNLIKMWSDIGDLRKALALAERKADAGRPDIAYRAAGDACRSHGRYKEALAYYEKVLKVPAGDGNEAKQIEKNKDRARQSTEAIKVYETLDLAQVPDGDYEGTATGFRGPLTVRVKVKKAKIEEVKVAQYKDDWFFTSLTEVPRQIIEKQGVKGVDAVTGATMTSEAIINATAKALATGMK
jgi:uncharacterized protein with FMN-binding domain